MVYGFRFSELYDHTNGVEFKVYFNGMLSIPPFCLFIRLHYAPLPADISSIQTLKLMSYLTTSCASRRPIFAMSLILDGIPALASYE